MVPFSRFLGYDRGEDGNLVVNREEAKTIKLIYGDFLAGLSCYAIAEKLTAMGVKTPAGKDKWSQGTVKRILQNEKYAGNALLQKSYIADFLTKKQVVNHGEVPQYFVEDNHEAIIEPVVFDRVQDMLKERSKKKGYSGVTIFSSRIRCGCCGGWYGSKVWHSTDKYRRVIWQCNSKFKDQTRCQTPHLTEDEIREAFNRVVNSLTTRPEGSPDGTSLGAGYAHGYGRAGKEPEKTGGADERGCGRRPEPHRRKRTGGTEPGRVYDPLRRTGFPV